MVLKAYVWRFIVSHGSALFSPEFGGTLAHPASIAAASDAIRAVLFIVRILFRLFRRRSLLFSSVEKELAHQILQHNGGLRLFDAAAILQVGVIAASLGFNLFMWDAGNIVLPYASIALALLLVYGINTSWGYFAETKLKRQFTDLFGQYVPPELVDDIWFRPGISPNCRSRGAVTDDVITSGLAPG